MGIFNGEENKKVNIFCIQEVYGRGTHTVIAGLGIRLPDYHTYNSMYKQGIAGSYGVLLAVSKKYISLEFLPPSHNVVSVRVDTEGEPLLLFSLYILQNKFRVEVE